MRFPLSTDLALQLEQRMASLASERPIRDKYEYEIVTRHAALPLFRGLEAYYALDLSGEVMEFEWRRFDRPTPVLLDGHGYAAIAVGANKYPELVTLLPKRAADDAECAYCRGTGEHPMKGETGDPRVICDCGGLGFVPRSVDESGPIAVPRSTVFPDITPSKYRATYVYHIDSDYDVQTDESLNRLLNRLLDDPEHEFVYYRPKDRAGNERIQEAIRTGIIAKGEIEFFHYRRAPGDRNFIHAEEYLTDDSHAEYLFWYEKRDVIWQREVMAGEQYVKTRLKLTDAARRAAEAERQRDRNPFEAKPGAFGFSVDLFKLWPYLSKRFMTWRRRRAERGNLSE